MSSTNTVHEYRITNQVEVDEMLEPVGGDPWVFIRCVICRKEFLLPDWLGARLHVHTKHWGTKYPLECVACNTTFTTKYAAQRHLETFLPNFRFQCAACGKMFARADYLRSHQRTCPPH